MRILLLMTLLFFASGASIYAEPELVEVARLGRGTARTLSWHPGGNMLAIGGSAGIWLFDKDYQQINHYSTSPVQWIRFSPDGKYLMVSFTNSEMTAIWQFDSNGTLLGGSQAVALNSYYARWSPDSKWIATYHGQWKQGEFQGVQVEVWNVTSLERIWTDYIFDNIVDVVWSPNSQYLASASRDGTIVIIDADSGEIQQTIPLQDDLNQRTLFDVTGIAVDNMGQGLWLTFDGSTSLWHLDLQDNELTESDIHAPYVYYRLEGLESFPNSNYMIVENQGGGGAEGSLYILSEGVEPTQIAYQDTIIDYTWASGTYRFITLTNNGMVRDIDLKSDVQTEQQLFANSGRIEWSPNSRWLLETTGYNPFDFSYPIMVWDISKTNFESYQPNHVMYPYLSAKWSRWLPDGDTVMVFSDITVPHALCLTYDVERWNVRDDVVSLFWEVGICGLQNAPDLEINWDYVIDWTDDFGLVASASGEEIFVAKESTYNEKIVTFTAEGHVKSVDWSPDENYLLSISEDQESERSFVEVWSLSSADRVIQLPVSENFVSANWSPDGQSMTIVEGENEIYTLSIIDTLTVDKHIELTFDAMPALKWKPDGLQLAVNRTPIEREAIDIIDVETGDVIPLVTHRDVISITGFDWHPSQDWLAISTGYKLIIYDVDHQSILTSIDSDNYIIGWPPDGTMLATRHPGQIISIWIRI